MPNESLEVTPADKWPGTRKAGIVVTLPSGAVARLRRTFSMSRMVENGTVPNPLQKVVREAIERGGSGTMPSIELKDVEQEEIADLLKLINDEIEVIFLEPQVQRMPEDADPNSWEPDEGFLALHEISWEDKIFAYSVAQGATTDLLRFRQAQEALAASQHGQDVRNTAEHLAWDPGRVGTVVPG